MNISYRPIERWPREFTKSRKASPFKSSYADTMRLLKYELSRAGARSAVVQVAIDASQFRVIDGQPYANAIYSHPGVIVSFEKDRTPLTFPCDAYTDWIDNLRAIALALEALRKVDRYGVTKHNEQYRGWNALPPATPLITPTLTVEEAAQFIANQVGMGPSASRAIHESATLREWYRDAAARWHPDRHRGEQLPEWNMLQKAKMMLDRHHGSKLQTN